jgi:hypothetical protein
MIRRDNPGWLSWGSYTSRMGHVSCPATAGVEAVLAFGKGRCEPSLVHAQHAFEELPVIAQRAFESLEIRNEQKRDVTAPSPAFSSFCFDKLLIHLGRVVI